MFSNIHYNEDILHIIFFYYIFYIFDAYLSMFKLTSCRIQWFSKTFFI